MLGIFFLFCISTFMSYLYTVRTVNSRRHLRVDPTLFGGHFSCRQWTVKESTQEFLITNNKKTTYIGVFRKKPSRRVISCPSFEQSFLGVITVRPKFKNKIWQSAHKILKKSIPFFARSIVNLIIYIYQSDSYFKL